MAVKRGNSFNTFSNNFKSTMEGIDRVVLNLWDKWTLQTLADAQSKAPVASGTLEGSGSNRRAYITKNGVQSAIVFKVDYAKKLNDVNSGLRLKENGELSYYSAGTKVFKQRKGELGFLSKAEQENKSKFVEITEWAVSKSFLNI
jgi:hypothetical protein